MSARERLLVLELWGVGDLTLASPFLAAASRRFAVTLLAKPFADELRRRFWPEVEVIPFTAPWTAFQNKYQLHRWPWRRMKILRGQLVARQFDFAVSARRDPRDHLLMRLSGAKQRLGFPRLGGELLLTKPLAGLERHAHRHDHWRAAAQALGLDLPPRGQIPAPEPLPWRTVLIHSGAAQPVRVWPLERFAELAARLRRNNFQVQIVCDPAQKEWWLNHGEESVQAPANLATLFGALDQAGAFIGNDSGPGHLAALCGVPTFTIFGNQLPGFMAPVHPNAEWSEGKPCPHKPCFDRCRFAAPHCLLDVAVDEVWPRVEKFASLHAAHD
ncbi:MAG: glycosyltransferase family 9 protein [Verrucomicrobia bacterium]|nr:glycosyltransferase family 9 protein [Verrucomicrobiota bacterium]